MTVGNRIREVRKQRGYTQKKLGELCGIAEPTIRRYENGKLNPKRETIEKIATALECRPEYIMGLDTYMTSADLISAAIDIVRDAEQQKLSVDNIGGNIKALREVRHISVDELSCLIGVPVQDMQRYERNEAIPPVSVLSKIAQVLNYSLLSLIRSEKDDFFVNRQEHEYLFRIFRCTNINDVEKYLHLPDGTLEEIDPQGEMLKTIDNLGRYSWEDGFQTHEETLTNDFGYSFDEAERELIKAFSGLNQAGKKTAIDRLRELLEIPKYQKEGD